MDEETLARYRMKEGGREGGKTSEDDLHVLYMCPCFVLLGRTKRRHSCTS